MKRMLLSNVEKLKRKYNIDLLRQVRYCRDEIRGVVQQDRDSGYSDDEIESKMGDYLDEIYESYFKTAEEEYGLSEEEFDYIYQVFEDIEGKIEGI